MSAAASRQLFTSLFQRLIGDALKDYIEGFDDSMLVWSNNDITLSKLQFKPDALNKLLPVQIKSGWVGLLNIKVKWYRLHLEPIQVTLEDVFIVAGTHHDFHVSWRASNPGSSMQSLSLLLCPALPCPALLSAALLYSALKRAAFKSL